MSSVTMVPSKDDSTPLSYSHVIALSVGRYRPVLCSTGEPPSSEPPPLPPPHAVKAATAIRLTTKRRERDGNTEAVNDIDEFLV